MNHLSRTETDVRMIASEVQTLLIKRYRDPAERIIRILGEGVYRSMTRDEARSAISLLEKTPAQRDQALAEMDANQAAIALLRARYLGVLATKALAFAGSFEVTDRMAPRSAAAFAAYKGVFEAPEVRPEDVYHDWRRVMASPLTEAPEPEDDPAP